MRETRNACCQGNEKLNLLRPNVPAAFCTVAGKFLYNVLRGFSPTYERHGLASLVAGSARRIRRTAARPERARSRHLGRAVRRVARRVGVRAACLDLAV